MSNLDIVFSQMDRIMKYLSFTKKKRLKSNFNVYLLERFPLEASVVDRISKGIREDEFKRNV